MKFKFYIFFLAIQFCFCSISHARIVFVDLYGESISQQVENQWGNLKSSSPWFDKMIEEINSQEDLFVMPMTVEDMKVIIPQQGAYFLPSTATATFKNAKPSSFPKEYQFLISTIKEHLSGKNVIVIGLYVTEKGLLQEPILIHEMFHAYQHIVQKRSPAMTNRFERKKMEIEAYILQFAFEQISNFTSKPSLFSNLDDLIEYLEGKCELTEQTTQNINQNLQLLWRDALNSHPYYSTLEKEGALQNVKVEDLENLSKFLQ